MCCLQEEKHNTGQDTEASVKCIWLTCTGSTLWNVFKYIYSNTEITTIQQQVFTVFSTLLQLHCAFYSTIYLTAGVTCYFLDKKLLHPLILRGRNLSNLSHSCRAISGDWAGMCFSGNSVPVLWTNQNLIINSKALEADNYVLWKKLICMSKHIMQIVPERGIQVWRNKSVNQLISESF